jgi:hypothetical protein
VKCSENRITNIQDGSFKNYIMQKTDRFIHKMTLAIIVMLSCSFMLTANPDEFNFYVSPRGNDSWSGQSIDKPFATVQRARDAIRELKRSRGLTKPVTVYLRGGLYELNETLVFKPEDSGSSVCPVQYIAYNDEKPVISGCKAINGRWKQYKGNIQVCEIDEVKQGKWYFRQLFLDGDRQSRASLPDNGFYNIDETDDETGHDGFKFKCNDLKRFKNMTDVEVVLFHAWNESRLIISDVDEQQKIVRFTGPVGRKPGRGNRLNRYYIDNVFEGLDGPGEWYLDRHEGKLYYWPSEAVCPDDLDNADLRAPVLNELLRFEGSVENNIYVEFIKIKGITFSGTDYFLPEQGIPTIRDVGDIWFPSAVTLNGVRECIFENNVIKNTGTYGLDITGDAIRVTDNEIYDTGSGGIITRSYGRYRNVITYNHIHHCSDIFHSGVGINIDDGGGLIGNNLVHNIGQSGIYGRHWSTDYGQEQERRNQEQGLIIEYNEIYNVMQKLNDGGGIFIRDDNVIIRNNLIHDVYPPPEGHGSFVLGIYTGCETRNCLVENNLVFRTQAGMHIWYKNRNNTYINNIFVDGEAWQIDLHNPGGDYQHQQIRLLRNIICFSNPDGMLYSVQGERSLPLESDYNIIYHTQGREFAIRGLEGVKTFEEWRELGFDTHSIIADPLFTDPAQDDYSLKPESPALKMGFKPIDISGVGLRGRGK